MDSEKLVNVLKKGPGFWNNWRKQNPDVTIDLTHADLNLTDLRGADLSKADLRNATLQGALLRQTNLRESNLQEANLLNAQGQEADLTQSHLEKAIMNNAIFDNAILQGASLDGASMKNVDLRGAVLKSASLLGTDLREANLLRSDLFNANLEGAFLHRALLEGADLQEANLKGCRLEQSDMREIKLNGANLHAAKLMGANLKEADLRHANLQGADLRQANLRGANLQGADLLAANLQEAELHGASLRETNLENANLLFTHFINCDFAGCRLKNAEVGQTVFVSSDLESARNLATIQHNSPSSLGTDTLFLSKGKFPIRFLRGCGLSDWEIESAKLFNPELTNKEITDIQYEIFSLRAEQSLQFSSLFISYSHLDTLFVDKFEKYLVEEGIRFWRDVHHATAGRLEKIMDHAIRLNPTVLLVLSSNSIKSDWVEHEVSDARKLEKELGRDVLCPIAMDKAWMERSGSWSEIIMEQVKKYNVIDFSKWKDESQFRERFKLLVTGLKIFY